MDRRPTEPAEEGEFHEPDSRPEAARAVCETPVLEELLVQLSAAQPRVGGDGGSPFPDCTHS